MAVNEPNAVGNLGSGESARAGAAAIEGLKKDLTSMLTTAKQIAEQFSNIAKSAKKAGSAGTSGAGGTGAGNPTGMANSLGAISDTGGGGGGSKFGGQLG